MALGKGIPVINGFDLNSKLPLDSRTVADTVENMNKLVTDGSVGDGQLCYCKADKKLYVLKDNVWSEVGGGGGGDIWFNLAEYATDGANFAITEEGYNLLYNGLHNGKYVGVTIAYREFYYYLYEYGQYLFFNYRYIEPENPKDVFKTLRINKTTREISGHYSQADSEDLIMYMTFYTRPYFEGGTSSIPYYNAETSSQENLTIGNGLTIENGVLKATGGSGGSSKVWYELPSLFFLENITQKQFDEIKNLTLQNQLAGINCAGLYCPLTFYNDGRNIDFFYPWYENDIFVSYIVRLNKNLSVEKIPYSTITLPQTAPTSQVIPSITTSNTQQNLTIGNGLEIKNGALQEKVLNVSITLTTEQLSQSINSGNVSINYTETDKSTIFDFIKAQNGIMKLTINTPIGALYMTLRPSLWKDDTNHSYNFEGTLYLETDLSTIGGTSFNQIIVRAICWDTDNSVSFRPTIIPIGTK